MSGEPRETLYDRLGLPPAASAQEIRARYLELVARYHPDKHADNPLQELAAHKLAELNAAYEVLSDPERRAAYDAGLPAGPRPASWDPFPQSPEGVPAGPAPRPLRPLRNLAILLGAIFGLLVLVRGGLRLLFTPAGILLALAGLAAFFVVRGRKRGH